MTTLRISLLILLAGALSACSGGSEPNVELIQDMQETVAVKQQRPDRWLPDDAGPRMPPENTVPVGFKAYRPGFDPALGKADKNPLAGDMSGDVLVVGQKFFETNCAVCHGTSGHGDGPVAAKMPNKPPSLMTDKIRGWADGQIYQVITMGQGTMGPYASHVPQASRWQVVNYIRHLQQKQ